MKEIIVIFTFSANPVIIHIIEIYYLIFQDSRITIRRCHKYNDQPEGLADVECHRGSRSLGEQSR